MAEPSQRPPTIDPVAAARWHRAAPVVSPWLHEEVARRMQDRLQWIRQAPEAWCNWEAIRGGLEAHALVAARYPQAQCHVYEPEPRMAQVAAAALPRPSWWKPSRWLSQAPDWGLPPDGSMQMLWSNMALHMVADPQQLFAQWHKALAANGYVMFSCLGPDTVRELHSVYTAQGWPAAGHAFTDMHDWGDMLINAGFAEPVMDMERITLTFATPERLLQELQELGCNLHPQRYAGLRTPRWRQALCKALQAQAKPTSDGSELALTFEIIYGHAFKPPSRHKLSAQTEVSLDDMRNMLKAKAPPLQS